jgi:hypothetical protein
MNALTLALVLASAPVDDARAALGPFKKTLKETLLKALETSPEAAIEVCSVRAPELARAASTPTVTVGRSAFKLRNPKNAAPAWLPPLMAELAKEKSGSEASRTVTLPDGRVGYAEPIWVAAPCLVCHGKSLAPGVDAKLAATYPNDTARGFELGAFRGVFWAEVKPAAPVRP